MPNLKWETVEEINLALAQRVRLLRQRRGVSQQRLSDKSGVSYASIRRFESSGQISLLSLTKIAVALDCDDQIRGLFDGGGHVQQARFSTSSNSSEPGR